MYSQNEKDELLNELKEMESLQIDMDNEGKILQEDIIDFLLNGNGNPEDLGDRIELYLYEFKLFCRKPVRFAQKDFNVYLNAVDIPFEKLDALLKDLDKFTLVIYTEVDKGLDVKYSFRIVGCYFINSVQIHFFNFSYFFTGLNNICRFISFFFCHG